MLLRFLGAARTVTGSMHLIEPDRGPKILLEAGLFQGRRAETYERNRNPGLDPTQIPYVILSHAHLDHCGNLPLLYRLGFRGHVFCTPATRDLASILLRDSAHLQERDVEFVNRRRSAQGLPPVEPLYRLEEAEAVLEHFVTVPYGRPFSPDPGFGFAFGDAGHILGSAHVLLEVRRRGRPIRIGFSGDLGRYGLPILRDPQPMPEVDYLILESTYGGQQHEPLQRAREELAAVIRRTAARGGKVLIPAFSVGRTQEILYELNVLFREGALPDIPVFLDSPLAIDATAIYKAHPECFDQETRALLHRDPDPFGFARLTYVVEAEQSKRLNELRVPAVIIAASGMMEGGRILHHLRHHIEDPRTTILVVGFCAEHTLCRRLVEGHKEVNIFGEPFRVRAEVVVISAYSAHAGHDELLRWTEPLLGNRLKAIFLVHGEYSRQEALAEALRTRGARRVEIPERGQAYTI
ncbi:MAG: MBL fold metallo-hydrolase [Bacteroidetes bacterium]|nr:MBL fold metallo-hydrolase [Rhodothermia bacterium]MCS7155267.1 MBL fold metallo-hydrolase [Bacteroidota bacterium]MCX7907852.1 MBL fold metallo-hydrolase [Bacteroidota bacterium]MDW8138671.1 MBL fold metallo-hydrolase [Bacteroidota bacterium]MDW8284743.1 MBL fold metallo-hydrolase [Bacteroidota bacterium]